jgi:hypothetical protein
MDRQPVERPFQVTLIAIFQFAKAAFLLVVAALLWLSPESLPHSEAFTQVLFIAAHGKDLPGVLVPIFGGYVAYVGLRLLQLKPSVRRTLAVSSAITVAVSLNRLGVFGDASVTNSFQQQTLYVLILLDLAVYIYLVFHPEIVRSFSRA